jgi:hypothetical protein
MNWRGEEYIAQLERTYGQRVQSAGYHFVSRVRENVSIPSRTVSFTTTRTGTRKKVLGPRGSSRSKPGEFSHKDYGTMGASFAQEFDQATLTSRCGSPMAIAKYQELGTKNMAARPNLRKTLAEERQNIADIIKFGGTTDIQVGE